MKKLITICLLIATTFAVNAQDGKPTKEETLEYLTKTFKLTEGETSLKKSSGFITEFTNTTCFFSIDKIIEKYDFETIIDGTPKSNGKKGYISSNLKWATVTSINLSGQEGNLTQVIIDFSSKYKSADLEQDLGYENTISLLIVNNKAEGFKKAIERLVEIAKEENKNPFEN